LGYAGIEQAAAFALDDSQGISRIHALIVARPEVEETALRAHCDSKLRDVYVPVRFIRVDDIPRAAQGKIDRQGVLDIGKAKAAQR
jgi:acyl-CoA synthetase (AMP-forming)/AMP-acid ligase II